jgi:GT2 family glycosyltransferase
LRALKIGVKLIYTPKAKIWHHHHLTTTGGQKSSPPVEYWKSYAVLMLTYLHLNKLNFSIFYLKYLLKTLLKGLVFAFNRNRSLKIKPILFAYYYFTKWLFDKIPNNGFNPLLK